MVRMEIVRSSSRQPVSEHLPVRGLDCHLTRWPGEDPAPVLLLHGYSDCGATFQFLAEQLPAGMTLVAPDWRGFGASAWASGGYWFPDYYADLDCMLERLSPHAPVDLVGHSMGGNIALTYAGLRPERVRRVVCLEGFGLPRMPPALAPERYRDWLRQLRDPDADVATIFPTVTTLAAVLQKRNPRLTAERALFVASAWSEVLPDGRARMRFDPAHKRVNPVLYRREEAEACWREIRARVLYVTGAESRYAARLQGDADPEHMRRFITRLEPCTIEESGHMLHHDQPERLARVIEAFLAGA
jgi:pimeloyl-ACP methyl ester carboxylesterase